MKLNKIKNTLLNFWIYFDVKLHLKYMQDNIKNNKLKISRDFFVSENEKVVKYIEYFTSIIYSKTVSNNNEVSRRFDEEAIIICDMFFNSYLKGKEIKDKQSIKYFLPRPPNDYQDKGYKQNNKNLDSDTIYKGPLHKVVYSILESINKNNIKKSKFLKRNSKLFKFIPLPSASLYLLYALNNCKIILSDIVYFSKDYGINYHGDGEIRCFYNAINMNLHFFFTHERFPITKKERLLIFVLSALHPAQDDLIDDIGCSEVDAIAIKEVLEGKKTTLNFSKSVKAIISLINVIYDTYKPNKHPNLVLIFSELHRWQLISKKQKLNSTDLLSDKELLSISFMKGGYAFALYGYVNHGSLTVSQFRHYFSMGAIFQIMDDFHDIEDDIKNNVTTVFTNCIKYDMYMDDVMYGLISMQHCFENNICESKDFKYPILIRFIELFGSRFDIFRFYCMNSKRFSDEFNELITYQIPFEMAEVIGFFNHTRNHETVKNYTEIVDELDKKIAEFL